MADVNTPAAAPSPAPAAPAAPQHADAPDSSSPSIPTGGKDYAKWRMTGELPEKKQPSKREASTPSNESSDSSADDAGENSAPASETGTNTQERKQPGKAESRLNEILEDLRRAGLSPSELKNFKREAQREANNEQPKQPEHTVKPADQGRPKATDLNPDGTAKWKTYDDYLDALADYRAEQKLQGHLQNQRIEAAAKTMKEKLTEANARYGAEASPAIVNAAKAVMRDPGIPQAIKSVFDDSPIVTDLLYAIGSKPADLDEFVMLARTNPGAALRKAVLIEQLTKDELGKGSPAGSGDAPQRGSDGKFQPATKKTTAAPPPPKEASGRGSVPPDAIDSARDRNDFRSYREAANRRDIQRRKAA